MKKLLSLLNEDIAARQAIQAMSTANKQAVVYGVSGSQKRLLLAAAWQDKPRPILIVTSGSDTVQDYLTDLAVLLPMATVCEFAAMDIINFTAAAKSIDLAAKRMNILNQIIYQKDIIVITTAEAIMQKIPAKEEFLTRRLSIGSQQAVAQEKIIEVIVNYGYERVEQVYGVGQFSVRGGIIDIHALNMQYPVRIELFGDEVDSIRMFDILTQRSTENLIQVDILPLHSIDEQDSSSLLLSYLPENALILVDEPTRIREGMNKIIQERPEIRAKVVDWAELVGSFNDYIVTYLALLLVKIPFVTNLTVINIQVRQLPSYHRQFYLLLNDIKEWLNNGNKVIILRDNKEKGLVLQQNLVAEGINAVYQDVINSVSPGRVTISEGTIIDGFEMIEAKIVVLAEWNLAGRQKKRRTNKIEKGQQIKYFRDIKIGDYVVHVNHGIGKYAGVETLTVGDVQKDYLLIKYAGEDKLYVPIDQVDLLHKYIGADGQAPRLHKMGGADWQKVKSKAKAAVADMANELIVLYAERQMAEGYAYDADNIWQKEFEEAFAYEETPDQLSALAEVKADMERLLPMDRLLCGDVGFGKTEIAIRAAFKAVLNGKQVAVLVPTTVLAQQHYQTFSKRFADFGPVVDVLSRFRSSKQQAETLKNLAYGKVDILIGTHRLLQQDVAFKDVGLLIVDEEQRFGVAQKEKIKQWRKNIDVLTLSATPIPRTLHMSLVGVRDMSIIETPPEDRLPVQTYVVEYQPDIIRDAINREIKRGGSVYFVYNRVQSIEKMYRELSELVPQARIGIAHGQMPEDMLENAMLDFYEGNYDVLLCTSIIENGLDIPTANTIVVYAADAFGLSQLYQMRGRVGRSSWLAYAYFTYRKDKVLTEVAEKRLQAIKEFTELGAGFKIAMRDLEIRGAGNLLGSQQHGHIVSVGFEMYCQLMDEAVSELKGTPRPVAEPEPVLELDISAFISDNYINNAMYKMEIYQRIAAIRKQEEITELLDELIDRFGEPPVSVMNLLSVATIKNMARNIGIRYIIQSKQMIKLIFDRQPNVLVERVLQLKQQYSSRVNILPGPPESIQLKTAKISSPINLWLENILKILVSD